MSKKKHKYTYKVGDQVKSHWMSYKHEVLTISNIIENDKSNLSYKSNLDFNRKYEFLETPGFLWEYQFEPGPAVIRESKLEQLLCQR